MADRTKKIINPTWTAMAVLILSILVVIFASRLLYQRTVDLLTDNLRERLLTISITAAANIRSSDIDALNTEEDWQKPEWGQVVNQLHKAKYSNEDIVFMYIFRKTKQDPTQMEFVADADSIDPYANTSGDPSRFVDVNRDGKIEPDGPDKLQWPGQSYLEAVDIPETFEAYNGPLTSSELYTDDYGTVLTGYAPIKDDTGNSVAILATDIKADDFFIITRQTLQPFLIFIASLTSIITFLVIFIILIWRKYTKSLGKLNIDLKELIKQRENLVHLVTHKVKGSFTRSKYIFAGILDGTFGEINAEVKKRAEQGLESDNMGIETVDLVLSVANMQKGVVKYEMKEMDLKDLVLKTVAEKSIAAQAKGLKVEPEIKPARNASGIADAGGEGTYKISGDAFWLKEVVNNLIENSIKYTKEGKITVGLSKQNNKVLLTVGDTGVGISAEDKKNLFTEGGRGKDSVKVNVDSTGYGLYSVKLIVEAHNGTVSAESAGSGTGSTFSVELPELK